MRPTVLIVDDHDGFRESARALLEAEGFAVVGDAADGAAAVAKAARLRPDVVLLDVGVMCRYAANVWAARPDQIR